MAKSNHFNINYGNYGYVCLYKAYIPILKHGVAVLSPRMASYTDGWSLPISV